MVAAADLALNKLYAVVHNPADRGITKTGRDGVFLRPGHHSLGGIHMRDAGTGSSGGNRGTASVGEQI